MPLKRFERLETVPSNNPPKMHDTVLTDCGPFCLLAVSPAPSLQLWRLNPFCKALEALKQS